VPAVEGAAGDGAAVARQFDVALLSVVSQHFGNSAGFLPAVRAP
jgi:hypothetical protein